MASDRPATRDYLHRLGERPLVLDGAMGTVIYERGVFVNACYDELSLSNPELIRGIHAEYADAGADLILTNTFGANRIKLRGFGLADRVVGINAAAAALAREAAGDALVAGDVGPCLAIGRPLTEAAAAEVEEAFREQIAALADSGVDLIFLETFADLRELQLAAAVARQTGLPVHASFTVNERGESAVGMAAAAMFDALAADPNVDTVGLNCAVGPAGLFDLVEGLLPRAGKPVLVKPNAGQPREVGGRMLYMTTPEYFTSYAKRFVELGVRGVGGCCGTTPAHIRTAAKSVHALARAGRAGGVATVAEPAAARVRRARGEPREVVVVPTAAKSPFGAKLARGEPVTSVEILPPKSPDLGGFFAKVRACHEAGIDAINIPDGPRASARVSPMVAALLAHQAIGIETIPHYCCRDRNLLGMQSDVLGAAAAGLNNLLVITGDPPKTGDYPSVTGVFDIDSIGLAGLIDGLNHGRDFGGNPINPPTAILIGVGANPCALDLDREVERFFRKIDAGAEYAITQPVFEPESLLRFLDRIERAPHPIPVIAGVWPLASYKNAEFMRNEVPGVVVPDRVMERLAACSTREEAGATGVELAREIIGRIESRVAGFQVSAPLGNVQTALTVLARPG